MPPSISREGPLLVATRSQHKLGEIAAILGPLHIETVTLRDAGLPYEPREEKIESFDTFVGNASAKAAHFAAISGMPTLADDSGLVVPVLHGQPGVRSRRFSGRDDLDGEMLDRANNERLLERLADRRGAERAAWYTCAVALHRPGRTSLFTIGTVHGTILETPRGQLGFGYDPLFALPTLGGRTFGECDAPAKHMLSHRGRAFRALAAALLHG